MRQQATDAGHSKLPGNWEDREGGAATLSVAFHVL